MTIAELVVTRDSNRIEWLDESKGIAIIFLCSYHVFQYFAEIYPKFLFFLSAIFPIFMFCSGIIELKKELIPFDKWIKKKAKGILLPWFVFSLINSGVKLGVLLILRRLTNEIFRSEMFDLLLRGNGPVYYLIMLFWAELILYVVRKVTNDNKVIIYISSIVAIIPFIIPIRLYFTGWIWVVLLRRVIVTYGFLIIGFLLFNSITYLLEKRPWSIIALSLVCIVIGTILLFMNNIVFDLWNTIFDGKILCFVSSILLGIGWIGIFKSLDDYKIKLGFLSYLGRRSLPIMLIHTLLLSVYTYPFASRIISQSKAFNAALSILLVVYVVIGSLIIYNIYRKVVKNPII